MTKRKCPICKKEIVGRTDKKFCSSICKNNYHSRLKKATISSAEKIDKILHRNRSILLELLINKNKISTSKLSLEKKGFKFNYCTGTYYNTQKKQCYYVYDFMWFELGNQKVYIYRINP